MYTACMYIYIYIYIIVWICVYVFVFARVSLCSPSKGSHFNHMQVEMMPGHSKHRWKHWAKALLLHSSTMAAWANVQVMPRHFGLESDCMELHGYRRYLQRKISTTIKDSTSRAFYPFRSFQLLTLLSICSICSVYSYNPWGLCHVSLK